MEFDGVQLNTRCDDLENILVYVHDPMCSWCYGFQPTWRQLKGLIPRRLSVVSLLGGLAGDSVQPMPLEMVEYLERMWVQIHNECGVKFNHDYWRQEPLPPRTTFIACRGVITAEKIAGRGEVFTERIQDAYYKNAANVWDSDVLANLAEDIGFCREAFLEMLNSQDVHDVHNEQRAMANRLGVEGYPSLILIHRQLGYPISIRHGGAQKMWQEIASILEAPVTNGMTN